MCLQVIRCYTCCFLVSIWYIDFVTITFSTFKIFALLLDHLSSVYINFLPRRAIKHIHFLLARTCSVQSSSSQAFGLIKHVSYIDHIMVQSQKSHSIHPNKGRICYNCMSFNHFFLFHGQGGFALDIPIDPREKLRNIISFL